MPEPKRKLLELDVTFISLVGAPANGKPLVLKCAGTPHAFRLVKTVDEQMRAYGIVYAPGEVDSQGDTADAEVIRKAADRFVREGRAQNVDKGHSFRPEMAFVAESWLVRKGDPLFPDQPEGAWAVGIQVGDAGVWRQLKSGELTGLSLAGEADVQELSGTEFTQKGDEAPKWFAKLLTNFMKSDEEPAMKDEEIKALVKESVTEAVTAAVAELKKVDGKPADEDKKAPPETVAKADLDALKGELETVKADLQKALSKGAQESGRPADEGDWGGF